MVRDSYGSSSSYGAMRPPAWFGGLVGETFFVACAAHDNRKKNEKNIFCLECCRSICPHCSATSSHRHHPLLQVRRYVYNDVVRLEDVEKLIDCSYVQAYTINSAKVVFLKQRPQSRPFKGSGNICLTCDRILQDPFHFCSLFCKVDHVMMQGQDLSGILHRVNDSSDISFSGFFDGLEVDEVDEGHITPNSILQNPMRNGGSRAEDAADNGNNSSSSNNNKKTSGAGFLPRIVLSLSNRRKGAAPQRAPLS